MAIEELAITNFRNLLHVQISPSPTTNFIIGNNGSGKTSLLETIYFLGTGRSFRTPHSKFLINQKADEFTLFSKVRKGGLQIGVGIARDKSHTRIRIANDNVFSASRLAELIPVQLINPDVHKLMEEGPRYRRRFIEWGVFHVKPNYHALWQQCTHILRQRNAALRLSMSGKELEYWDEALSDVSAKITNLREEYLAMLQPVFDDLVLDIPGISNLSIALKRGWPDQISFRDALRETREQDHKRGFTQHGPHRADLKIMFGKMRAKDVVSRGQQKMIATLLKLAQLRCLIEAKTGSDPVLLVDDLPAELDKEYREILIKKIIELPSQNFITATSLSSLNVEQYSDACQMFHVEHGRVNPR
ncbi:DNA replication/repair protein RecF [Kaarinaea lacus]